MKGNARLYQFMNQMRDRRPRLGRILTRTLNADDAAPPLYGGCYVAGTGRDPPRQQAFVAGVFRRLMEEQNFVAWTDEAIVQEARCERWSRLGYIGMAVGTAALVLAGYLLKDRLFK
jgi:hypothetical protein